MKTGGKILLTTGILAAGITAVTLASKSKAADALILNLDSLNVGLKGTPGLNALSIPKSVIFKVAFKATNPSKQELRFSAPFVTILADTKAKKDVMIGNSTIPTDEKDKFITLPAKSTNALPITVEIPLLNMLMVFPDYVQYAWGRMNGEPSTRFVTIQYQYDAYGFNQSDKSKIAI